MWIVIYYQYGNWSCTCGFKSIAEAERHADLYLRGKGNEHKQHVTPVFVRLPVNAPPQLPREMAR